MRSLPKHVIKTAQTFLLLSSPWRACLRACPAPVCVCVCACVCLNIKSLLGAPGGAGREQVSEPELDEGLGGVPLLFPPPSYHLHAEMLVRARLPRG